MTDKTATFEKAQVGGVKGFNDIRPGTDLGPWDARLWQRIIDVAHDVFSRYGLSQVWLPIVEHTALFARGIGDETDVVSKEMYSFEDRGGRSLSLRPEGTAGAARAFIEHHLSRNEPVQKWYYFGPMFRAERPQKGRYRQFYQLGAEILGASHPASDVELILLVRLLCQELGLPDTHLRVNTLGDVESRRTFIAQLGAYLGRHQDALCESCRQRTVANPLRVLDCKRPSCQAVLADAPDVLDALSEPSRAWFDVYLKLLEAQGVPYERDRRLVRGLDYYSDAIFELTCPALGAQDALLGGGRYDRLIPTLGGPPTPAVGFAAGLERLALLLAETLRPARGPDVFIALQDQEVMGHALDLAQLLRKAGCRVDLDASEAKLKQAMRRADRTGAQVSVVLGQREVERRALTLKRLIDGSECSVAWDAQQVTQALKRWPGDSQT